jgi:LysR family transcriptional regulator, regulator for bpeEF and oprC
VRTGPLEDSGLLVKPLMVIRLGAYASSAYLANREVPDSPAQLRQHSCITTSCGTLGEPADSALWRLRRGAEVREVRVESRVSVPDPTINYQLALAGAGVALLSQLNVRADVEQGRLIRLLPEWEPEPVELHAVYSSRLNSSPKVRAFLQFLRNRFGSNPDCAPYTPKIVQAHEERNTANRG